MSLLVQYNELSIFSGQRIAMFDSNLLRSGNGLECAEFCPKTSAIEHNECEARKRIHMFKASGWSKQA